MAFIFKTYILCLVATLIIGHPLLNGDTAKPICSKYDYEEKLLEKMIRMEMKMEKIVEKVNDKDKDITSLKTKMTAVEDKLPSALPIIGFNVRLSNTASVKKRQPVVYDTEIINQGGGYDKSTGSFTAPLTGMYFFSAHVCNRGNSIVQYSIYHEGTYLTTSTQYDNNGVFSCSSVSAVAVINKAEKVSVQCLYASDLYTDSARWNSFTGALLYKQVL